eukprot:m.70920 g.70920  ORF g.70920 m.70920 type:complete len:237 (+) comp14331_c0_seq4:69-779(+)
MAPSASYPSIMLLLLAVVAAIAAVCSGHPTRYRDLPAADCHAQPTILSYHIHVTYNFMNEDQIAGAMALRSEAKRALADFAGPDCDGRYDYGRLCFIVDHDFNTTLEGGPFPVGEWSIFVPIPYFAVALQFMMQRHGEFPLLIHPNTGCEYEDHSIWAMWTGVPSPQPLDLEGAGMIPWTQTNEFNTTTTDTTNIPCLNSGMTCRSANPILARTESVPCCFPLTCPCAPGETCACK